MHIPDGMLDTKTWVTAWLGSAGAVGYALRRLRQTAEDGRVVLMAVLAALVFAMQMLNFPVGVGTSGHFTGGAAAAIVLGPWAGSAIMASVVAVQALLFADGGITALGANLLDMAVVAPLAGWWVYSLLTRGRRDRGRIASAAFAAGWLGCVLAALGAALMLWLSGRAPLGPVVAAMGGWHALIGVGEGVITAGLVTYLLGTRPDLLDRHAEPRGRSLAAVSATLALVALAAAGASFLASAHPDALEYSYARLGEPFAERAAAGPLADYLVPGVANDRLSGVLAGVLGLAVTAVAAYALAGAASHPRRRRRKPSTEETLGIHRDAHRHEGSPEHAHPHHHTAAQMHEHAHGAGFERYAWIVSPVHSLDARTKVLAALALVLAVVLLPPPGALELAGLVAFLALVAVAARLPLAHVLARSALVLPFVAAIALIAPLTRAGAPLTAAGFASAYADGGWVHAYAIAVRAWLAALAVVLLSATTPVPEMLRALRGLRVPGAMLTLLSFTYRFLGVLGAQLTSLRRALASRAPALTWRRRLRLLGHLGGNLFVRTYERGERVHAAMLARGYDGTLPTGAAPRLRARDAFALTLTVLAIALMALR